MKRLITLTGLGLAGVGVSALVDPERVPATFGGRADTPDARSEIRATYGGAMVAAGVLLLVRPRSAGTIALVLAGAAAGRAAGVAIEGEEPSDATKVLLGLEVGSAAALLLARGGIVAAEAASAVAASASEAASSVADTASSVAESAGEAVSSIAAKVTG